MATQLRKLGWSKGYSSPQIKVVAVLLDSLQILDMGRHATRLNAEGHTSP